MRIHTKLAAAAALLFAAVPAQAATILGQISFIGFVRPIGATNMGAATGLDFYNVSVPATPTTNDGGVPGTIFASLGSTGIFAGVKCGFPCGSIQDLPTFSVGPINGFVNIGSAIFFDLGSIDQVSQTSDVAGGSLKVIASGQFRIDGFGTTPGLLTLTTQGNGETSFSATALSAIPEPANWAMMIAGFGLLGGVLRARRSERVRYAAH